MILTTAALAAVVIALSDPFERNGSVKASFVSEQTYEECTKGKEKTVFDPSILRESARPGDTILFKASHGMHLEKVLSDFLQASDRNTK